MFFFVILQCSQTICFSGWSRHWKSWYFFSRSTRHDINSLGEHGKIVWRHTHCWIIETCKAGSQERYQPPQTPPKKQQCENQECLASYKKKLIACARVRCKRRVDSVAASPREYLVRRAAKNVISPAPKPPQIPPKKQQCENQECLASYKKKLIACARVRCKRRVDSVAASPREYLVRRAAKNVISPPKLPQNPRPSISRGPTTHPRLGMLLANPSWVIIKWSLFGSTPLTHRIHVCYIW